MLPKFETDLARARCPRSSVEAAQKCSKIKGEKQSSILLTFGKLVPACIKSKTWGTRICCRLRCVNAYDQQKKDLSDAEMDTLTKSCSPTIVKNSQWRSADAWRGPQFMSKNWVYSWLLKVIEYPQQCYRSESFAMKTDILMSGSTVKNHISLETGLGYNVIRRTSFRSWVQACHRVPHPVLILQPQWHLQESVTILHLPQARASPTTTVSSDSETRERGRLEWNRFSSSNCVKFTCWRDDRTVRPIVAQANQKTQNPNKNENQDIFHRVSFRWTQGIGLILNQRITLSFCVRDFEESNPSSSTLTESTTRRRWSSFVLEN